MQQLELKPPYEVYVMVVREESKIPLWPITSSVGDLQNFFFIINSCF